MPVHAEIVETSFTCVDGVAGRVRGDSYIERQLVINLSLVELDTSFVRSTNHGS